MYEYKGESRKRTKELGEKWNKAGYQLRIVYNEHKRKRNKMLELINEFGEVMVKDDEDNTGYKQYIENKQEQDKNNFK